MSKERPQPNAEAHQAPQPSEHGHEEERKEKTQEAEARQKTCIKCKEILFGNSITSKCKCCSKCCASAECNTDSHTKFKADSAKYTKWKQDRALSAAVRKPKRRRSLEPQGREQDQYPPPEHGSRQEKIDESEDAFWTAVYKGVEAMDAFVHSNMNAIFLEKQIKCLEQYAQKNKPMDVSQHEKKGDNIELDDISEVPVLSFMVKKIHAETRRDEQ